jgi:hypothetical protein
MHARTPTDVVQDATGPDVRCPCCAHAGWRQFDGGSPVLATPPERPSDYGGWLAGFFPVRFYCEHCGFVRLHVVPPQDAAG